MGGSNESLQPGMASSSARRHEPACRGRGVDRCRSSRVSSGVVPKQALDERAVAWRTPVDHRPAACHDHSTRPRRRCGVHLLRLELADSLRRGSNSRSSPPGVAGSCHVRRRRARSPTRAVAARRRGSRPPGGGRKRSSARRRLVRDALLHASHGRDDWFRGHRPAADATPRL